MKANTHQGLRMLGVEDVRETNELKLLHIIRDRQPISRVDLVKATGVRAGTVSVIVNRLLRASVVHEGELVPSSGAARDGSANQCREVIRSGNQHRCSPNRLC